MERCTATPLSLSTSEITSPRCCRGGRAMDAARSVSSRGWLKQGDQQAVPVTGYAGNAVEHEHDPHSSASRTEDSGGTIATQGWCARCCLHQSGYRKRPRPLIVSALIDQLARSTPSKSWGSATSPTAPRVRPRAYRRPSSASIRSQGSPW